MNRRLVVSYAFACAVVALAGCDSGREAPPRVTVRVANVAPGFENLTFRREQDVRNQREMTFKATAEFSYDVDTYDFFVFERSLDINTAGRSWTFAPQLEADTGYTFVLTEVGNEVVPVVLSYPAAPASDAQIVGLHAAGGLPALDLYLEAPGVGIAGAAPRGTFDVQGQIAPTTLPSGEYEVTLTAAGDPANVLLTSTAITLPAGSTAAIIVVPEGGQGPQPLTVFVVHASSSVLYNRSAGAELRVINAATDQAPRDVALNNEFSPPLFAAVPFAQPSANVPTPVGAQPIAVTPVGNPGVLELNQTYSGIVDRRTTMLFAGPAGTLTHVFAADDGRRIHNEAKLRLMNGASQFTSLEFVLTMPDADPAAVAPFATVAPPGIAPFGAIPPGAYDLYLRQTGTTTLVSGPTRITVAAEGIYEVLAVDGADTATAGVVLFGDFP